MIANEGLEDIRWNSQQSDYPDTDEDETTEVS